MKGHVAVIQTSFIGDAVLSLPFLKELLELTPPSSKIIWVSAPRNQKIISLALQRGLSKYSERVVHKSFDKKIVNTPFKMRSFWRQIEEKPSYIFCLQRSFRTALLASFSGAKHRVGFSSGAASFLYTDNVIRKWNTGYPEIEKNLDLLRHMFPDYNRIWDTEKSKPTLLDRRSQRKDPKVVFSVGSPWPTKRWKTEHYISLANQLCADGVEVVLSGDKAAKPMADAIQKGVPSLLFKNQCGETDLVEWVDLIETADVLVSGDSAAVHVASDLDVPAIAIFGPTIPEFGYAPWRRHSKALGVSHLDCRPCDIHGPKTCPKGHHKCMLDLPPDRVYREISRILVDRRPKRG